MNAEVKEKLDDLNITGAWKGLSDRVMEVVFVFFHVHHTILLYKTTIELQEK